MCVCVSEEVSGFPENISSCYKTLRWPTMHHYTLQKQQHRRGRDREEEGEERVQTERGRGQAVCEEV